MEWKSFSNCKMTALLCPGGGEGFALPCPSFRGGTPSPCPLSGEDILPRTPSRYLSDLTSCYARMKIKRRARALIAHARYLVDIAHDIRDYNGIMIRKIVGHTRRQATNGVRCTGLVASRAPKKILRAKFFRGPPLTPRPGRDILASGEAIRGAMGTPIRLARIKYITALPDNGSVEATRARLLKEQ